MDWKLGLDKDVGSSPLPREPLAEQTAVLSVEIELRRTDARGPVIISGLEKTGTVNAILQGI
jgi:hypothetical protein